MHLILVVGRRRVESPDRVYQIQRRHPVHLRLVPLRSRTKTRDRSGLIDWLLWCLLWFARHQASQLRIVTSIDYF